MVVQIKRNLLLFLPSSLPAVAAPRHSDFFVPHFALCAGDQEISPTAVYLPPTEELSLSRVRQGRDGVHEKGLRSLSRRNLKRRLLVCLDLTLHIFRVNVERCFFSPLFLSLVCSFFRFSRPRSPCSRLLSADAPSSPPVPLAIFTTHPSSASPVSLLPHLRCQLHL